MKVRVLVCGGRDFTDRRYLYQILHMCHLTEGGIIVIIHGGASGADTFAEDWATMEKPKVPTQVYEPEWDKYPRHAAPPIRNREMLRDGKPDLVLAFPGGTGTEDMVCQAIRARCVEVRRFYPPYRTQQVPLML